jgi:hypothetical protein
MFPPCFDDKAHHEGWLRLARMSKTVMVENVHCQDCTPECKSRMRAVGRCSNPTHQFPKETE